MADVRLAVGPDPYRRHHLGVLGHLDASDTQAAVMFLGEAGLALERQGCTFALGPMDGNTWQGYRCALNWDNGPPFWGEPQTDPRWVAWLTQAGFVPVARYESRLCQDLTQTQTPRWRRQSPAPVRLTSAQGSDPEKLLAQIHGVVMASFQRQPFFQPLPEVVFAQQLRPVLAQIDPGLLTLAWVETHLVGFALALPDPLAPVNQRRIILKTLAVLPGRTYGGLGYSLLEAAHRAGAAQGYRQAIHALMHSRNSSLNLSRHYSQPWRDYVLMGKWLGDRGGAVPPM